MPWPEFFAYAAGLSELAGALLLVLFTRPAAFFISITMFVAGFINHANDPFAKAEKAYLYFAIAILYLVLGSGRFSADSWIRKRLNV